MKKKNVLMAVGLLLAAVFSFTACKKNNGSNTNIPVSGLMAFNLVPDKGAIGITLSDNMLPGPLAYQNYTGGYLSVYSGTRTARAFDYYYGGELANATNNYEQGKYYSLFVVGNNKVYSNVIVNDNLDSLVGKNGQAYVRYINAIPDSSKLTVSISSGNQIASDNNVIFKTVSDFKAVAPGNINIAISNGKDIQVNRTISVQQLNAYTVLLTGITNATDTSRKVQIKYITNGTVADSSSIKISDATTASGSN